MLIKKKKVTTVICTCSYLFVFFLYCCLLLLRLNEKKKWIHSIVWRIISCYYYIITTRRFVAVAAWKHFIRRGNHIGKFSEITYCCVFEENLFHHEFVSSIRIEHSLHRVCITHSSDNHIWPTDIGLGISNNWIMGPNDQRYWCETAWAMEKVNIAMQIIVVVFFFSQNRRVLSS